MMPGSAGHPVRVFLLHHIKPGRDQSTPIMTSFNLILPKASPLIPINMGTWRLSFQNMSFWEETFKPSLTLGIGMSVSLFLLQPGSVWRFMAGVTPKAVQPSEAVLMSLGRGATRAILTQVDCAAMAMSRSLTATQVYVCICGPAAVGGCAHHLCSPSVLSPETVWRPLIHVSADCVSKETAFAVMLMTPYAGTWKASVISPKPSNPHPP